MKVETFACDQCKTQKKDANHWFRGLRMRDSAGVLIVVWDRGPLGIAQIDEENEAHLCGADCVTQWLSKNLLN